MISDSRVHFWSYVPGSEIGLARNTHGMLIEMLNLDCFEAQLDFIYIGVSNDLHQM